MFDIGFSELMLIAVVALVVLGPERLPKVARTAGHLLGRLQRYVNDVKADINREIQLEELKKMRLEMENSARDLETTVSKQLTAVESDLNRSLSGETPAEHAPPASADVAATLPDPLAEPTLHAGPLPEMTPQVAEPSPQMELGLESAPRPAAGQP
ncbi:MAG TPA: Sec-independent protein translocase protein TatB [Rhodocyclaceae bacterium]|nr:Sec-independent protein translocase subunit TatB [Rhodocyclaceae bacterium]HMZ83029.1 Sec-independent protein translocase protein TatB [Rhodocyclaceae bacterium]HNA03119.1 Sec-independent protein translocase protein TatB [Rhodocyclaceae bacterium]HNB78429.1 Sec-independent protein translocase protein TatB [Rhodocyclaceae bacterium]HNC60825.1 Sec-independent protein translocase protein TatB [Rhodocyclaceae bacterium]